MRQRFDLHCHTTFSDGRNSAEEMVLAAVSAGLEQFGISDHSYTPFDLSYCMDIGRYREYSSTLCELKLKYGDRIRLLFGIECDSYSEEVPENLDYVIGSVHYIRLGKDYYPIDISRDGFMKVAEQCFQNDYYAFCEAYYETVSGIYERTGADIVGHFDLIAKYNEGNVFFDEGSERYRKAWQSAMLRLLPDVSCFEINYSMVNRGTRSVPYLNAEMQKFLLAHGGRVICSSDSHSAEFIGRFGNGGEDGKE